MIRQAILATALVASLSGIAVAQAEPPPPPPPHGEADGGPGMHRGPGHERASEEYRDRWEEGAEKRRGPGGPAGPEGRHHPRPPEHGKGIEIRMGRGEASVRIKCGDELMAECLAAAKPILDGIDRNGPGGGPKHERPDGRPGPADGPRPD